MEPSIQVHTTRKPGTRFSTGTKRVTTLQRIKEDLNVRKYEDRFASVFSEDKQHDVLKYFNLDNIWGSLQPEAVGETRSQKFEALLKERAHEHEDSDRFPLFYYIERNDLTRIKLHLEELVKNQSAVQAKEREQNEVTKYDTVGGTVFHLAYMKKRYKIARFLVQRYPKAALLPFRGKDNGGTILRNGDRVAESEMPYNGQNILHCCIVDRNIVETRWLIDFYRNRTVAALFEPPYFQKMKYGEHEKSLRFAHYETGLLRLLTARAYGSFFDPDGMYYFGGYPLFFALCCGNIEIFDLVLSTCSNLRITVAEEEVKMALEHGKEDLKDEFKVHTYAKQNMGPNAIFIRDTNGNNCLHFCVIHGLENMYAHVMKRAHETLLRQVKKAFATQKYLQRQGKGIDVGDWFVLPAADTSLGFGHSPVETLLRMPKSSRYDAWLSAAVKRKLEERLVLSLNEDLHSALTMCAAIRPSGRANFDMASKKETLLFILKELRVPRWSYGPVTVSLLDLEGVETPYRRQHYLPPIPRTMPMHGAIEWLCITDSDECLTVPELKEIVQLKWDRCGFKKIFGRLVEHIFLTCCLTVHACLLNANPYYDQLPQRGADWAITVMYPINLLQMLVMLWWDMRNAFRYRLALGGLRGRIRQVWQESVGENPLRLAFNLVYCILVEVVYDFLVAGTRGAAKFNRLSRMFTVLSFVLHCVFSYVESSRYGIQSQGTNVLEPFDYARLGAEEQAVYSYDSSLNVHYKPVNNLLVQLPMVLCILSAYSRMFYFLMGFTVTGPFVLVITKILTHDLVFISAFYAVTILAFGVSISMLWGDGNPRADVGFYQLLLTFWVLFKNTVSNGAIDFGVNEANSPPQSQKLFDFIWTMFTLTLNIMFLNLLIALINSTYNRYTSRSEGLLILERYNMLCLMDLPLSARGRVRQLMEFGVCPLDTQETSLATLSETVKLKTRGLLLSVASAGTVAVEENETEAGIHVPASQGSEEGWNVGAALAQLGGWLVGVYTEDDARDERELPHVYFEFNEVDTEWWSHHPRGHGEQSDMTLSHQKVALLLVDPQNCFHPEGGTKGTKSYHSQGSLAVPGANEDAERVAKMIDAHLDDIDEIFVTLDTHHKLHIAHATSWRRGTPGACSVLGETKHFAEGDRPLPFTVITHSDIDSGIWIPESHLEMGWVKYYVRSLENVGHFDMTIWPDHGLVGSTSHAVVPAINETLQRWARHRSRNIQYVTKGTNLRTECFSAVRAEVEDPLDARGTSLNRKLLFSLEACDKVVVAGQAMSHSVAFTVKDIVKHTSDPSKLYLLRDGCSAVSGYELAADDFVDDISHSGAHVATTANVFRLMKDDCRRTAKTSRYRESMDGAERGENTKDKDNVAVPHPVKQRQASFLNSKNGSQSNQTGGGTRGGEAAASAVGAGIFPSPSLRSGGAIKEQSK